MKKAPFRHITSQDLLTWPHPQPPTSQIERSELFYSKRVAAVAQVATPSSPRSAGITVRQSGKNERLRGSVSTVALNESPLCSQIMATSVEIAQINPMLLLSRMLCVS